MRMVAPVRRELGIRTLFNILGPLTNPAGAENILMGVFHPDLVGIQVRVLQALGAKRALVVWGAMAWTRCRWVPQPWSASCAMAWCASTTCIQDFGIAMAHTRNLEVAGALESKEDV